MLRTAVTAIATLTLGLALACGATDDPLAPTVFPHSKATDGLWCDTQLRRFFTDTSHPVDTAVVANVAVAYVQSELGEHCPPDHWNPQVSNVVVDDAGNIDISFAIPSVRTGNNAVTATGEGSLQWVFLVTEGRWYAADPHQPALEAKRSTNVRPTAKVATPVPTSVPTQAPTSTPEQTTAAVTDRDVYEEAYATCNGYYQGVEVTRRKQVARLKSLEGLLDALRRDCGQEAVAVVAAAYGVAPAPVPTWPPLVLVPVPTPTWPTEPTRTWPSAATTTMALPMPTLPYPALPTAPAPTSTPAQAAASSSPRPSGDLRQLMLELTNERRAAAAVPAVRLGNNRAAQLHVEAALAGCYSSHYDRWGLKPNHRYTLAGGTGADGENIRGHDYCYRESDDYAPIASMAHEVRQAVQGWMGSPGHRGTCLTLRIPS